MMKKINELALQKPIEKQRDVMAKLQWRWFPVEGNVPGAHHIKYLSVDEEVVIMGSTNMDTQSINRARETSIAVDDATTTRAWDEKVFLADFRLSKNAIPQFDDGKEQ
jgi:phosphatidylserine/phosphatidylglycerophosphate/cardiolipin synthase-like enzyme